MQRATGHPLGEQQITRNKQRGLPLRVALHPVENPPM
jgi:hypothetical protein